MAEKTRNNGEKPKNEKIISKPKCGIIMPISEIAGLGERHWLDVKSILSDAIRSAGFEAELVSTAEEVGIIQKTIIQNLYENPIMVCDVSGRNPNVMFELGMRLAFDKPTIIVKDDQTSYTFDMSPIEHLNYPRDLRFGQIVEFKETLAKKVKNTYEIALNDPGYTTFLKHFGEFTVAKIEQKEVSGQEYIIEELRSLKQLVARLDRKGSHPTTTVPLGEARRQYYFQLGSEWTDAKTDELLSTLREMVPNADVYLAGSVVKLEIPMTLTNRQLVNLDALINKVVNEGRSAALASNFNI